MKSGISLNMRLRWCFVYFPVFICGICDGRYDNPDCIVDKSLEASATNNYMDCKSPVMVELGKTECCQIDAEVGCCQPNGNWEKMKLIGIGIGCTTFFLALLCIYCFWCRKNPHVARVEEFMKKRYHTLQEKCSCLECCRKQVAERKRMEALKEKAQEIPALELPAESSNKDDTTFDSFWRGPMVKS